MKSKVSIIVPVYNVAEHLSDCLDSLTNQTLKGIQIICINDGSTDDSLKILKQYAKHHSNIRVVNQKNGGRSAARNAGLAKVSTPYVMFCDSDDFYDRTMCQKMVKVMEQQDVDLAACGIKMIYLAHNELTESDSKYYRIKFTDRNLINDNIIKNTDGSICNKIFKTQLIKKHQIQFPNNLNNEDYYFYNAYMSVAQAIFFLPQKLYNYIRHDNGSIMSEAFERKTKSLDHLLIAKKLFNFYKKNGFLKKHTDLFWHQFCESFWFSYAHSSKEYHREIQHIGEAFIAAQYSTYLPESSGVKNEVSNILHNHWLRKIIRRFKNFMVRVYKKINIAYRQQEKINRQIDAIEQNTYDLVDRLENIIKTHDGHP